MPQLGHASSCILFASFVWIVRLSGETARGLPVSAPIESAAQCEQQNDDQEQEEERRDDNSKAAEQDDEKKCYQQ